MKFKYRLAVIILVVPCILIDMITLPILFVNWIITGTTFSSLTQEIFEQHEK
jgi:hypothetical protein